LDIAHGDVWKSLRKNMSPTFTSGKLKGMLEPMSGIVDKFLEHIKTSSTKGEDVEVKPLFQGK
jgi:cytochrome P450